MPEHQSLRYLFVDMNAFFASVEQQERPELRGRPIGVVPVVTDSTCCIATSYEAKKFGVKTGTNVGEARRMCPGIEFIRGRHRIYTEYHHRIHKVVEDSLHVDDVMSIDEMYGRLMGAEREPPQAIALARRVQQALHTHVGSEIHCSVGLAPSLWLAKVASTMRKPGGIKVIQRTDLPHALHALKLDDLYGIGRKMKERFIRAGVNTVSELCELSEARLIEICRSKVIGAIWYDRLRGMDAPIRSTHRRTVGHSHVLAPEYRTEAGAYAVLVRMLHKVAVRLRRMEYVARRLDIHVSFVDRPTWKAHADLPCARDTHTMLQALIQLWRERPVFAEPRKVGIVLTRLERDRVAPSPLFPAQSHMERLSKAMDHLDTKYGRHTIYFGSMFEAKRSAPPRIAFSRIPDLDEFDEADHPG